MICKTWLGIKVYAGKLFDFELFVNSLQTNNTILNENVYTSTYNWCLKDRLSEIEMRFYAIFTARKGNYSVISRVKLKTITNTYSSPFGIKKHEPNQKENPLEYATLLLKTTIFYAKIQSLFISILTVPFT